MNKKEKEFVKTVWDYYERHGRRSLPWRSTKNPYYILVSELMLQQTQVDRVIPKYTAFLKKFPTISTLAQASLGDILREWQGLGYNRRAKMLHLCAQQICTDYKGRVPKAYSELLSLHGVGPYTAGAVMAFAYNVAMPIIETNIRNVFIHHFFKDEVDISDEQLFHSIGIVLDIENPREWYYALMDYGSHLKKTLGNQNIRSKHYSVQSAFKNSDRHIRGVILQQLSEKESTRVHFHKVLSFDIQRIDIQLERLREEGMIVKKGQKYFLP